MSAPTRLSLAVPFTRPGASSAEHATRARPRLRLGAASPGGLGLPDAAPTAEQMYAPRGVHLSGELLVIADTGNHRVLLWHGLPSVDGAPADVVLGQPDFTTEGAAAGGRGPANGMQLPTGVTVIDGDLHVADAWHHRVLVYDGVPTASDTAPAAVIGQGDDCSVEPNRGGEPDATSLYWPFGIAHVAGWTWIADTGNKRVLGWRGRLEAGRPADVVLGQDDEASRSDNRGRAPDGGTFRWPHAIAGTDEQLLIADAGNHRVLLWSPPPTEERPADRVLGQDDLVSTGEWPYGAQGPSKLRFPYGLAVDGGRLAVADTADNRVLLWDELPTVSGAPAVDVLGQAGFDGSGENRWESVRPDTLCWPYGIALDGALLAVADSGNNRVVLWNLEGASDLGAPAAVSAEPARDLPHVSAGTPAGEVAHVVAGTPSGEVPHVSAGTPSGDVPHVSAGTPSGEVPHVSAGTPSREVPHVSAGTPSRDVPPHGPTGTPAGEVGAGEVPRVYAGTPSRDVPHVPAGTPVAAGGRA